VSWRGGTKGTNMAGRSIPLAHLRRLLAVPGCEFVSLQYGEAAGDVAGARAKLGVFPAAEIDDFEDLAGLIANLDLVVSVQTAVVHLCGALGKDALVMVPVRPEWRYGAEGETLPWYRSVRILRQDATESWAPVIDRAARAVAKAAGA
jgi:ADP-heptose:LPS heptosyltransferase